MTQYNRVNVKLLQKLSPNMVGNSTYETSFPHNLVPNDRQICKLFKDWKTIS